MNSDAPRYDGYRFPPLIISHAVWLSTESGTVAGFNLRGVVCPFCFRRVRFRRDGARAAWL